MADSNQDKQQVDKQVNIGSVEGGIDQIGDRVGGDKITAGDVSGSYNAIGRGAMVIVNQVQQALSAVDELDKSIQVAERRLAEAIQGKLNSYTRLTETDVGGRGNPYKALLDYKIADAPFFYGRDDAIEAMLEKIQQSRLTILHSESGSGKSSLLQAGLASRLLAEGDFPLYLRPYDQRPDRYIKKAFLPDYATQEDLQRFNDEQMTMKGFLERVTHYLGARRLVIFLDQFEEFFTLVPLEQRTAFAGQLRECVQSDLAVWWVLALRKEYFSDVRIFRELRPFDNEYFLPAFTKEEAWEVVTQPAVLKGVGFEAGLVDRILADLRQEEDKIQPPQVQLVCYTLFDELSASNGETEITFDLYNQRRGRGAGISGAAGILTSHLSSVLERELTGKERKVAGRVLEELITSDRRRVKRSIEELQKTVENEQIAQLEAVLAALYANRLVRRELDEDDLPVYELAHDYLAAEIELDVESRARKSARELLSQEARAYGQFGSLIPKDRLKFLYEYRDALVGIDSETAACLLRSAVAAKYEVEDFTKRAATNIGGLELRDVLKMAFGETLHPLLRGLGNSWQFPQLAALGHEKGEIRIQAARTLGKLGDERAIEPLIAALKDPYREVREAAVMALGQFGELAFEPLVAALNDDVMEVRWGAHRALVVGGFGNERAAELLFTALNDETSEVRVEVAVTLGRLGDERAITPLIDALKHGEPNERWMAAGTLGFLGSKQAVEHLIAGLGDEDENVRQMAARALGQFGDSEAIESLIAALKDKDWYVRSGAAWALGKLSSEEVQLLGAYNFFTDHETWFVRKMTASAIKRLKEVAIDPLIDALEDEDEDVRQKAAWALGQIGDSRAIESLIELLKDEYDEVGEAAREALGELGWVEGLKTNNQQPRNNG